MHRRSDYQRLHQGEKLDYRWPEGIKNLNDYRMYLYNSETVEEKLRWISLFLEDGDYEKYMPMIYGYTKKEKLAIQRQLVRWLWIRCRCCELDSAEHHDYERMLIQQADQIKP